MPSEAENNLRLEIGHVLFIDIVGYSKLLINQQSEQVQKLQEIVRGTEQFRLAEAEGKLLRLPTGDGGALVFRNSPEAPVLCALEISKALKSYPALQVRMGIHSGPVNEVTDLNEQANIAGAGVNIAQRVMDCGDAGHILLSKRVAEDLEQYAHWKPHLHDIGQCEVKHGARVSVVNLCTDDLGNPAVPEKLKVARAAAAKRKRAALRWIALGALALLVAVFAIGFLLLRYRSKSLAAAIPAKSVAVLPLENLTEEKENAFFADGIQDELLSNLSKIKDLKVISRTSVMQYKSGIKRNLKEIAQQLGVSSVVEGSVRRSGNHIRVSVQLIDARTDRHIWAQNYDRTLADSLALQGELATEIATGVGSTLSPQEKARVEATPTKNTSAYDAYLRGRAFAAGVQGERSNVEGAIRSFREAVKLDPNFTLAWIYLSRFLSESYWMGLDPSPAQLAAAKEALDRALALDPNLPETHLALGYYRYHGQRDFAGALAEFQQAEKDLPNNVDVMSAIALIQRRLGHWEDAIAKLNRAVELDPRNLDVASSLAFIYGVVRRFPEMIAAADRMLAVEPANENAIEFKVTAYLAMGDLDAVDSMIGKPGFGPALQGVQALARRDYAASIKLLSQAQTNLSGDDKRSLLFVLGLSQQRAGDVAAARATYQEGRQETQRALEKVTQDPWQGAGLRSSLGVFDAALGDASTAIAEGQKAMASQPSSEDPFEGPSREEEMAQIYALLGDANHAIPILRRLLTISYAGSITPAVLRIDPIWDPIRNDPRFQELATEKKP
jgi:TolB-like protein/class 3 adenylate cyclase/cytochrome c-type biogenesis protein CcmH/NrfG